MDGGDREGEIFGEVVTAGHLEGSGGGIVMKRLGGGGGGDGAEVVEEPDEVGSLGAEAEGVSDEAGVPGDGGGVMCEWDEALLLVPVSGTGHHDLEDAVTVEAGDTVFEALRPVFGAGELLGEEGVEAEDGAGIAAQELGHGLEIDGGLLEEELEAESGAGEDRRRRVPDEEDRRGGKAEGGLLCHGHVLGVSGSACFRPAFFGPVLLLRELRVYGSEAHQAGGLVAAGEERAEWPRRAGLSRTSVTRRP